MLSVVPLDVQSNDETKTLNLIRKYIASPPVNSRVFLITPTIAEVILREYNHGNRPKKPRNIALYAAAMQSQRWALTGATVSFSVLGRLLDGQNRMMACVRAGVPFKTHVIFGIDDEAFDRIDQGRNRDASDILAIAGHQNTNVLASAIRWVNLIEENRAKQRDSYTPGERLRLLRERYPDLPSFIQQARLIYERTGQPTGLVTALIYLFNKTNPIRAPEFARAWETANWAGHFKAIGTMQGEIARLHAATSGRVHDVVRAALIIMAWNTIADGRRGTKKSMTWTPSDDFPVIAP